MLPLICGVDRRAPHLKKLKALEIPVPKKHTAFLHAIMVRQQDPTVAALEQVVLQSRQMKFKQRRRYKQLYSALQWLVPEVTAIELDDEFEDDD